MMLKKSCVIKIMSVLFIAAVFLCSKPAFADEKYVNDVTSYQWGNHNDGTFYVTGEGSKEDFDIRPPQWNDSSTLNAAGVIAIMDTGVDVTNPELAGVFYPKLEEKSAGTNGGKYGFNAAKDNDDVTDNVGHGTHVAGIAAGLWDGQGISGVANGCSIVAVKVMDDESNLTADYVIRGFRYLSTLMDNGVDIIAINCSLDLSVVSSEVDAAIREVGRKGAVTIFAAGNSSRNREYDYNYTSSMMKHNPYVIVVDDATVNGNKSEGSCYGETTSDLFAPGTMILSSYPKTLGNYLVETDSSPVFSEYFDKMPEDIIFGYQPDSTVKGPVYKIDEITTVPTGAISINKTIGFENKDSLAIDVGKLQSDDQQIANLEMYVRIKKEDASKVNFLSVKVLGEKTWDEGEENILSTALQVGCKYKYSDPESGTSYESTVWLSSAADAFAKPNEWQSVSLNTSKIFEKAPGVIFLDTIRDPDDSDYVYLPINISFKTSSSTLPAVGKVYIDILGAGSEASEYQYLSGTSMAAPSVTGAAAVAAKIQQDRGESLSGEVSAKTRANMLKGMVSSYDTLDSSLCRQGGMLDLRLIGDDESNLVPVINEIEENADEGTVTIKGAFFGNSGDIKIGGKAAEVNNWSNKEITVKQPETSGLQTIEVTKNEKTGKNSFIIEGKAKQALFENVIILPEEVSMENNAVEMTGCGGYLYCMFRNDTNVDHTEYKDMWRYDPISKEWQKCKELPKECGYVSLSLYDEKIYAFITAGEENHLYSYDTDLDSWTEITLKGEPIYVLATLANVGGDLYLFGGIDPDAGEIWTPASSDNIVILNIEENTATAKAVGDLINGACGLTAAVNDEEVYLYNGYWKWPYTSMLFPHLQKVSFIDGVPEVTDLDSMMPDIAFSLNCNGSRGMSIVQEGMIISPESVLNEDKTGVIDADTFLCPLEETKFSPYSLRAYPAPLAYSSCFAYNGYMYVAGMTAEEYPSLIMRSTSIETIPANGDKPIPPPPHVVPDSGGVPSTADNSNFMIYLILFTAALAAASVAIAKVVRKNNKC